MLTIEGTFTVATLQHQCRPGLCMDGHGWLLSPIYSVVTVSLPVVVQRGIQHSIMYSLRKLILITFQPHPDSDSPVCTRAHAYAQYA